jgi:acyl carrier protein phosphodiesterase
MPYISKGDRQRYIEIDKAIANQPEISTKGDLEFLVFRLMVKFMSTREPRYSTLHEVVYAVQHCADEYRRRFLDVRENQALLNNGDIKETVYFNEVNEA